MLKRESHDENSAEETARLARNEVGETLLYTEVCGYVNACTTMSIAIVIELLSISVYLSASRSRVPTSKMSKRLTPAAREDKAVLSASCDNNVLPLTTQRPSNLHQNLGSNPLPVRV
jgi:hypothetical protein